ncbi:hypothetical protein ACWEQ3_46095 [Streptomyces mirabilis]
MLQILFGRIHYTPLPVEDNVRDLVTTRDALRDCHASDRKHQGIVAAHPSSSASPSRANCAG